MSVRVKVYGLLAWVALVGGAAYLYKTKPAWFARVVRGKPSTPQKDKKPEKEATPVELAVANRREISSTGYALDSGSPKG